MKNTFRFITFDNLELLKEKEQINTNAGETSLMYDVGTILTLTVNSIGAPPSQGFFSTIASWSFYN